jgi:hypothetical protein
MFRTPDADEWLPADPNTPLDEGDGLWTSSGSRVEIQLADGSIIRLDSGSQLDVIAVEEGFTHLHLGSGRAYVKTALKTGSNSLQIDADDTTVLPDSRTRLRIDMLPNSLEDIAIFKGSAYVEGNGERTKVRAGEHIALEDGHSELLSLNLSDNWEKWNSQRDRTQYRTSSTESYLPDELQSYSGELDSNGRWLRVPEYGMVWRPTVILSDEWAPYRSGRWIWKGDDYVWVSTENWGWVPYHYGRWAVVTGFGWCWVPPVRGDIYWGPGYVGWYRSGNHVGWTPLAPGETFYGRKHYGQHSVSITGSNSTGNPANIVYKNRDAHGGFSVLLHNDFLKGRPAFQSLPNRAAAVSVSLGSPRLQPLPETRMPIIKQIPPRVAPPVVQPQKNRELRDRFPRVNPIAERQPRPHPPAAVPAAQSAVITPVEPSLPRQSDAGRVRTNQPPPPTLNQPVHRDQPPPAGQPDKHALPGAAPRQGEPSVQGARSREQKPKKVWKVKTTEQGNEKIQKEQDNKESKGKK